jgi:small-conductance mechanosensitive channel
LRCAKAARSAGSAADPEPSAAIEFGDSALKLQLRFWIADAQNGVQNVKSAVLLKIWEKFKEQHITVPYPQRDVHLVSTDVASRPQRDQPAPRCAQRQPPHRDAGRTQSSRSAGLF